MYNKKKNKNLSNDPGVARGLETTLSPIPYDHTGSTLFSTSQPSSPGDHDSAPSLDAQAVSNASNNQTINNSIDQSA